MNGLNSGKKSPDLSFSFFMSSGDQLTVHLLSLPYADRYSYCFTGIARKSFSAFHYEKGAGKRIAAGECASIEEMGGK